MTQANIRASVIGAVNAAYVAAYPLVPIVYDNAAFDRNSPPAMWVEFEIKFAGGDQVGMSLIPRTRVHGFVYVSVWAREGTGSKASLQMLDWFAGQVGYASVGGVFLQAPEPVSGKGPPGWYLEQSKFYFYTAPA